MNSKNYFEKPPKKIEITLYITFIFIALYIIFPLLQEITHFKSFGSLAAKQLTSGEPMTILVESDGYLKEFPLYSLLLALINLVLPINAFTCQLPIAIAILITTFLAGHSAARAAGHSAGVTAGTVVMCAMSLAYGTITNGNIILATACLTYSWMTLYRLHRVYAKKWTMIWLLALPGVFLAIFAIGLPALVIFYLPFLFFRRPIKLRYRLLQVNHLFIISVYSVLSYIAWSFIFGEDSAIIYCATSHSSFWQQLHSMLQLFTPWLLLGWPIYCFAFQSIETTKVFNHFCRVILTSSIIFALVLSNQPDMVLICLPLFAIGTGVHYDILTRRYYIQIKKIMRLVFCLLIAIFITNLIITTMYFTGPKLFISNITDQSIYLSLGISIIGVLMILYIHKKRGSFLVLSARLGIISTIVVIGVHSLLNLELNGTMISNKSHYNQLNLLSSKSELLYSLHSTDISQELFHVKNTIKFIDNAEQLPLEAMDVYVITAGEAPILETRKWELITEINVDNTIALWKGVLREEEADISNNK